MALAEYGETVEAIYHAAAEPAAWTAALERVADHVGAMGALIAYHDFEADRGILLSGRLREDLSDLYVARHGRNDFSVAITRCPPQIPFRGRSLVDAEKVRGSEMYADILVPQGIVEQIMIGHAPFMRHQTSGGMAVMLDTRQVDEADRVTARLERIAQHLSHAIELGRALARGRADGAMRRALIEALPGAVLVLDAVGTLIEANRAGEALLRTGNGLATNPRGRIGATFAEDDRRLVALIQRAGTPLDPACGTMRLALRLQRRAAPPLLIVATPLPRAAFAPWDVVERGAALILQVYDPLEHVLTPSADLARFLYGLTVAEARVAVLIGSGLSTPQTAVRLNLTANTVRTHLSRCFDKTGARSQVALTRLLAALPAQAAGS